MIKDKSVRCDHCPAEAWVIVTKGDQELNFCAHAYNKNSVLLHAQGWEILEDERALINDKPSVSANAL